MAKVHHLNVNQGDCIILEHDSGRVTMFDICAGNIEREQSALMKAMARELITPAKGNFRMCEHSTNPLDYLKKKLYVNDIWRFILSHPEMDHLDGFNALLNEFTVSHFWDSGAKKQKPDFSNYGRFKEEDWDRYADVITGETSVISIKPKAGSQFKYANEDDNLNGRGDDLHILAPDQNLIDKGNETQDFNDASYVVLWESSIGKVLLTGDAHDKTWEYIEDNHKVAATDVDLLIAPHHGRKSGRSYQFLDYVNPKLTLFGCAPSENLAYDAWNYRKLTHVTNNQCGCIVAQGNGQMDIYVENDTFAEKSGGRITNKNDQGFYYLGTVA